MKDKCKECKDRPTQLEKLNSLIQQAKAYSVVLISGVIIVGILIVFGVSLLNKQIPGIAEMNLFVSIVLGVVATIVSIVSMLFSFYGLEKTEESERRQLEVLSQIRSIGEDTRRSAKAIENTIQTGLKENVVLLRDKESAFASESNPADEE